MRTVWQCGRCKTWSQAWRDGCGHCNQARPARAPRCPEADAGAAWAAVRDLVEVMVDGSHRLRFAADHYGVLTDTLRRLDRLVPRLNRLEALEVEVAEQDRELEGLRRELSRHIAAEDLVGKVAEQDREIERLRQQLDDATSELRRRGPVLA